MRNYRTHQARGQGGYRCCSSWIFLWSRTLRTPVEESVREPNHLDYKSGDTILFRVVSFLSLALAATKNRPHAKRYLVTAVRPEVHGLVMMFYGAAQEDWTFLWVSSCSSRCHQLAHRRGLWLRFPSKLHQSCQYHNPMAWIEMAAARLAHCWSSCRSFSASEDTVVDSLDFKSAPERVFVFSRDVSISISDFE